jgi:hypothetical protein
MSAMRITALSLVAIVIVAAVPSIARERDQCYEPCKARCAAKYACERRNAGPNCFTNYNKCRSFCWRVCRH